VNSVVPKNYQLEFEPNFKDFSFQGKEVIEIYCKKPTSVIKLNAAELKISRCSVISNKQKIPAKSKLDAKKEELKIYLTKKIKGKCFLNLDFKGTLNDKLLGFYRSKYIENGKTKYLATTQFEAADARRAFPCWDEPSAKATFDISIKTEKNLMAISNMPIASKKIFGNKIQYNFSRTPIMSTYLIYLGVGEFEFLESKAGKIKVRVITTKGNKSRGKYSLDLGKKLLLSYEKYFGIKYPLPKLDLIAVPDFAAGAMENWGAITFRETILLYDPKTSSTRTKQYIAEVISHELAHMWFGNLVTMKWWNDLWLNESFATFMATKFTNKFYPEWELWDQFIEDAMNVAMSLDALKSSHPIDVKVNHPSEIREIFDAISYDKGGCVLRMLEHYVGESKFRQGLKVYLNKHKYGNAEGKDLWNTIGKISKLPVTSLVNTWINQVGFPVVQVKRKNSNLLLQQSRFLLDPDKKTSKAKWFIPISILVKKKLSKSLMTKTLETIPINGAKEFIVNSERHGFYRVKYDKETLQNLKKSVSRKTISYVDRWAIQNDLFSLCVAGQDSIQNYLDFSTAYSKEDNYLVSSNVSGNLNSLYFRTFHESFSKEFREYATNFLKQIFNRLGWDPKKNEKHTDAMLRSSTISALGKMGDKGIILEAEKRFKKFLTNPNSLRADLRDPVYSIVAWNGNEKTYSKLISLYKKAKSQEEKLRFLGALCSFKDEKLLIKSLNFSVTPNVRSQNMQLPIMRVSANPYGKKILWPWLKKNWKLLSKKVGHGNPLFNRIVASISLIADSTMEKEIRLFFENNPTPGTARTLEQTLERIRIHSKLLHTIRKEFKN